MTGKIDRPENIINITTKYWISDKIKGKLSRCYYVLSGCRKCIEKYRTHE